MTYIFLGIKSRCIEYKDIESGIQLTQYKGKLPQYQGNGIRFYNKKCKHSQ